MAKAVRKTSTRSKPKSASNASAKKVKRSTAKRSTTAAKRAATTATRKATTATRKTTQATSAVTDDVMKISTQALQDMWKNPAAAGAPKQVLDMMGTQGMEQFSKTADVASRSMGEAFSVSKENVDACVSCGNIAADASKHMGAEIFNYANQSFTKNVELSKELFGCRTLNDWLDLQSKVMKTNLDGFFSESVKLSEMMFDAATKASEPLNESVSKTAKTISKTLSEAA